ncbi:MULTISPECIES: hypothetical protein [unclassified Amycolatopsis]|uniref:hypothetical protein n=1 Tax=unclassified Amycolatopsis TaxID=2618356 RepID=UPI001FF35290|nr:hypothetical protein [Amycolatopsis sp. FBCC-B4732]UOX92222.1 hypothetical protein MUY14_16935 [Amycolatopsis sp. FBCC-B4732]
MPRRRLPERATPEGAGRIFLPVMLVVFGLGTIVLLIAGISVLSGDLAHGGETSPWFLLALFATAVQLIALVALAFRRRWGARVFGAAFVTGTALDLLSFSGVSGALVAVKILVAGVLAAAILVRWDDLVA